MAVLLACACIPTVNATNTTASIQTLCIDKLLSTGLDIGPRKRVGHREACADSQDMPTDDMLSGKSDLFRFDREPSYSNLRRNTPNSPIAPEANSIKVPGS